MQPRAGFAAQQVWVRNFRNEFSVVKGSVFCVLSLGKTVLEAVMLSLDRCPFVGLILHKKNKIK